MSIAAGVTLSPYEIISPLGAGGMGEVYRARDTRLNREVAIKVLPADFAKDADRLRRFEQEARATSALNHPNILTIYDISNYEGAPFVVAELLEGEELRAQLNHGALPVRKAIEYAQQITAGLAAAHERGIVHRDLKPENLFVTKDGRVKILDFGLAKLKPQKLSGGVDSEAPTMKPPDKLTNPGVVMGTVGYMSPEQVRGQDTDHRSDIFTFGIILHEMLSGTRTFTGDSLVELMNAILKDDPPELSETNAKISPQLEKTVQRCLEKKPELRFQNASDLGFALEALSGLSELPRTLGGRDSKEERARAANIRRRRLMWPALGLPAATAVLLATLLYLRGPSPEVHVTRLSIPLPKETNTLASAAPDLALSPDGRHLVFSASAGKKRRLWLRALDSFVTQPLAGTDDADTPFWSPDGKYVAFFADNKLKKLDVASGVVETLCPAGAGRGGAWNRQGVILFCAGDGTALSQVNAAGGTPKTVTELDAAHGETNHDYPSFLPDGRHYLFHVFGRDNHGIYVGDLNGKERKLLIPLSAGTANSTRAVWSASGHILYALNRSLLLARAFDPDRLEFTGEPFRIAENVIVSQTGNARFAASANGVLAFLPSREADVVQLTWCDRRGQRLGVIGPAEPWTEFALSPDERSAALIRSESSRLTSLWLLDLTQGATARFVEDTDSANYFPVWNPDGNSLAFASARNSPLNLFLKSSDGHTPEERLLETRSQAYPLSWSPDGKFLLFALGDPQTRNDIWLLPLGERKPQPLLRTKADERGGKISPNGQWLAYQSDGSGSVEVYVTQFPQPARSWLISRNGGGNPAWRGDGRELFFVAGNKLMTVDVGGGGEFKAGPPHPLFEIEGLNYAPSQDGQRFLTGTVAEKAPTPPINVVLNWTAELKK